MLSLKTASMATMVPPQRKYHAMTKAEREEFTRALIEAVRHHPAIWQMENGVYRDNGRKAKAWLEISAAMGQTEQVCQTTWKNARAYYSKIKREKAKRSEELDEPVEDCFWVHFKSMDFLAPYVDDRQGKYRQRREAMAGDDDEDSLQGLYTAGPADHSLQGLSMVSIPSATMISRSATSTPSSAGASPTTAAVAASSSAQPASKRPRLDQPIAPEAMTPLTNGLDAFLPAVDLARFETYIEAVVAKKVFSVLPAQKPMSPGAAFGNFIGIILDSLPEHTRNEKVVAILSLINHPKVS